MSDAPARVTEAGTSNSLAATRPSEGGPVPIACVANAIPPEDRPARAANLAALFGERLRARIDHDDGLEFHFAAADWPLVSRFVDDERKCCPFLRFTLELSPEDDALRVRLRGPAGTKELLEKELPIG